MIAMLPIIMGGQAALPPAPGASPTIASVYVPSVSGAQPSATPNPLLPTPMPTTTPFPDSVQPTATATIIPPTPTFTPSATFTPAPLTLSEMPATVRVGSAPVHIGPSAVYTQITTLNQGTQIRLRGRTAPGDWVYACCLNDLSSYWIRPAYVNVDNATLPTGAPTGSDPKSLRWLAIQPPDPVLTPRPVPTGIPAADFPLAYYNAANTGRVPILPSGGLTDAWPSANSQAGQEFTSPVAVLNGTSVIAANNDGNLYGLFIDGGNQRWRAPLPAGVRLAPSLHGNFVYLLNANTLTTFEDQNGNPALVGNLTLPVPARTPINIWLDTLFVGAGDGDGAQLIALQRPALTNTVTFNEPTGAIRMPAIGQETVYVAANQLYAIDANVFDLSSPGIEIIWSGPSDLAPITLPPIYAYPGRSAPADGRSTLADLYVADGTRVHALDANTGTRLWLFNAGYEIKGMAVNADNVFLVGPTQIGMISRERGEQRWLKDVTGSMVGGPLVTDQVVLIVTLDGGVYLYNTTDGSILNSKNINRSGVTNGVAVSNGRIFFAAGNTVYAFVGSP